MVNEYTTFEYEELKLNEGLNKNDSLDLDEFLTFLDGIWKRRDKNSKETDEAINDQNQRFYTLLRKDKLKQNNYVGVIQYKGRVFNLLPKICKNFKDEEKRIKKINLNILWWLTYTPKIKFPKNLSSLDKTSSSFLEIMIWLFASYTKEVLSKRFYQQFTELERETSYVKGKLLFNEYVKNYYVRGKWDKLYCQFESYELDNLFNRIIKYVATFLLQFSSVNETKRLLSEIIFLLDDVELKTVTIEDCYKVKFNYFQDEFESILEYCKLFLSNSSSINLNSNLKLFAFLIPMEQLFEDFIYGFISKELRNELEVKNQESYYLVENNSKYTIRPDLEITYNDIAIIADTKYKIIYDKLSNSGIYQMISYGIRRNCQNILLLYPEFNNENKEELNKLEIIDEIAGKKINIHPLKLKIIEDKLDFKKSLEENFKSVRDNLIKQIKYKLQDISSTL